MKLYGNLIGGTIRSNFKKLPEFTYTGVYETIMEDGGWKIKFKTSGTFKITKPTNTIQIDAFLVGGGGGGGAYSNGSGGGGGGGFITQSVITLNSGINYTINIGNGGNGGTASDYDNVAPSGGTTTAFGLQALGGGGGHSTMGRDDELIMAVGAVWEVIMAVLAVLQI